MKIVIANQKGGVGKSTLATNIAVLFATKNKETMLIDHDTSHASLNFFRRRTYYEDLSHFHAVAPKSIDDMIELLELPKDTIVVDLGGFTDDLAKAALIYADMIIVPTSTSTQDMDGNIHFMETISKLREAGLEAKVLYVANNVDPRMKQPRIERELDYITDMGYKIIATIPHYTSFSGSHGAGQSIVEFAPDSKAASYMINLVNKIEAEFIDESK